MVLRILSIFLFFIPLTVSSAQIEIVEIEFTGNKNVETSLLSNLLNSETGDDFQNYIANSDRKAITNYYVAKGYIDAVVTYDLVNTGLDFTKKKLVFTITENPLHRFGQVTVLGNREFSLDTLLSLFRGEQGKPFFTDLVQEWQVRVIQTYDAAGMPYTTVSLNLSADPANRFVTDIELRISESRKVYFRNVKILSVDSTALRTDTTTILDEMEFQRGDLFNSNKIAETVKYLYRTNIFQNVNVEYKTLSSSHVNTDSTNLNQVDSVDVIFRFREKKNSFVGISTAISTDNEQFFIATPGRSFLERLSYEIETEIGRRNIWSGKGTNVRFLVNPVWALDDKKQLHPFSNRFGLFFDIINVPFHRFYSKLNFVLSSLSHPVISTELSRFVANYSTTYLFDIDESLEFGIAFDNNDVNEKSDGIQLDEFQRLRLGFSNTNVISISSAYRLNRKDNFSNPSNGYVINTTLIASRSSALEENATDVDYLTLLAEWRRYQPIDKSERLILATNLKFGGILSDNILEQIPNTSRLYSGVTVRGYEFNLLGPVELDVDSASGAKTYIPFGGKYQFVANFELRYNIYKNIYSQFFIDVGGLWKNLDDIGIKKLRYSYGAGLSYDFGVVITRFEYGLKFKRKPYDVVNQPDDYNGTIDLESPGYISFGFTYHF
ncbi:MAG: BamA/TamA family outer membrane protein [Calditrichaeota bacterium]|nr:BamA/TamA family outer membrane protein [Calditrichota bacterium]